jgi:post-segregation antitoxin (ccd killing protein)
MRNERWTKVNIRRDVYARLVDAAWGERLSASALVERAINRELERLERKRARPEKG